MPRASPEITVIFRAVSARAMSAASARPAADAPREPTTDTAGSSATRAPCVKIADGAWWTPRSRTG